MPQYLDLTPLDEEGMRSDRPSWEVKWKRLENVIFQDGSIRLRPGFRNIQMTLGARTTYTPCPAVALPLIRHPGTSITGRESGPSAIDTLTPTATTENITWSIIGAGGTVHGSIDEDPPDDDTTLVESTTNGDTFTVTFDNPSTTYDDIAGILLRGRAQAQNEATSITEGKLTLNVNGTDLSVAETVDLTVTAGRYTEDSTGFFWEDFAVWMPNNPATSKRWTRSDVNALTLKVTNDSESVSIPSQAYLKFSVDGTHTDWGSISDINNSRLLDSVWVDANLYEPSAVGDKQSFKLPSDPFGAARGNVDSIVDVQLRVACIGPIDISTTADISLFFIGTDAVEYPLTLVAPLRWLAPNPIIGEGQVLVSDINARGDLGRLLGYRIAPNVEVEFRDYRKFLTTVSDTNPETGLAWTETDLKNAEFGITFAAGNPEFPPGVVSADVKVNYTGAASTTVDITYIRADAYGFTAGSTISDAPVDRLWFGTHAAFRLDNEATGTRSLSAIGWTDVTGSIPDLTTPGIVPLDWAVLFGQAFVVNGKQNTFFYPNGSDKFDQLADSTTGKTVASFADRLLVGWVKDGVSGNITPERVAYSARNDATDWTGVLAGDFDLIQTPGGVVKILGLTEDVAVAYKEQGIYNIRQTGNFVAPLVPDLIDKDTEALAMRTVVATVSETGSPYHIFLGRNPTSGITVFGYDGQSLIDLGRPISRNLVEEADLNMMPYAHASIHPETNTYWLFVTNLTDAATGDVTDSSPDTTEGAPKTAWVMDLRTGSWTRAVLPFNVSASEAWPISRYSVGTGIPVAAETALGRLGVMKEQLVLGNMRTLTPSYTDLNITYDEFRDAAATTKENSTGAVDTGDSITGDDFNRTELVRKGIYAVIETGDYRLSEAFLHNILYRLHLYGPNRGAVEFIAATSITGGTSYATYHEEQMGTQAADKSYLHTIVELDGVEGRRHRVQLVYQAFEDENGGILDINEMVLQYEGAGDNP